MPSTNELTGQFLECCDCFTICPCWVSDRPDEGHCSSLYIWTFGEGVKIGGHLIEGKSVAVVAFYASRGVMQSAIYTDATLKPEAKLLLHNAFSGESTESLKSLKRLMGTVVALGEAQIDVTHAKNPGDQWNVTVTVKNQPIASAHGMHAVMEGRQPNPITLNDTALHDELGLEGAVTVQAVERFEMAVSPLPGGPFVYAGRSGMAGKFKYKL